MEAAKDQEATAMLIHVSGGRTRAGVPLAQTMLQLIQEEGDPPGLWYCDTTSDVEEALASHKVLKAGAWLWVELPTYEAATCLKTSLAQLGVYAAPNGRTRGGPILYCFRVWPWNCHTIRNVSADWEYQPPPWCFGSRVSSC